MYATKKKAVDNFSFGAPLHEKIKAPKKYEGFSSISKKKKPALKHEPGNVLRRITIIATYVVGVNETNLFPKSSAKKTI